MNAPALAATPRPPLVAIGASAGGLDALERLFAGLPPDSGASYVVIQHLSPDHKSMMANLLSRHTQMPVVMVEQDTPIEADHVYLIPPGSMMHLEGLHLRLTPKSPRSFTLPIDVFFNSMAGDPEARLIGVILSGTGSDGTRGAAAINEAGGLLLAQDPADAKFDGMPRSVIASGLVDAVLPAEAIGPRILAHLRSATGTERRAGSIHPDEPEPFQSNHTGEDDTYRRPPETPEAALEAILELLQLVGGIDFKQYKSGTVMRRIERRMAVRSILSMPAYHELLASDRTEVLTLRRELLIPVTRFFRDTDAFEALSTLVVDPLVAHKPAAETIRVWAAGVATGEEAYSLAILFMEAFERHKRWPGLKIFATDVEQPNIDSAGAGCYPESLASEVSQAQLERFFVRRDAGYAVKPDLRQSVVFARHNLLADPPFTKMDLVVCRNTLIYFNSHAQDRALRQLQYALVPKGCLFLGPSESLGALEGDYTPLSARAKIWQLSRQQRASYDSARAASFPLGSPRSRTPASSRSRLNNGGPEEIGLGVLLKAFEPPPAVLVNSRNELVHSYGNVHRVLKLREGHASLELSRMLPEPLVAVASALLFKAGQDRATVSSDYVRFVNDADMPEVVQLSAWPAGEFEGERLTLLAFEPQVASPITPSEVRVVDLGSESLERIELLERELAATRENLQAAVEELETSNEELQATNEELMSSNEELQSANEELQSVNEELNTVNAEYQEKIDILNHVNADLDYMAQAVAVGTVFVDEQLRLMRFSPDARAIFRLRDSDIGRPLEDLTHTLDYPELTADLARTLQSGQRFEREVRGPGVQRYYMRMLPYQVPSKTAKGAVASFMDVTALHQVSRLQGIIDALSEHVAVVDPQGTITMVNRAWQEFAVANGDPDLRFSGPGTNYLQVCATAAMGDETAQAARQGLADVLQGKRRSFSIEYPCHSSTEQRWFVMNVSPVAGEQPGAVVSHFNVSAWRRNMPPNRP